jgi:hypothetical protein
MKPMMTRQQIRMLEKELLALGKPRLDILEWGCGGSTYHYTRFLKQHEIEYSWISVEHQKHWYEQMAAVMGDDPRVTIRLETDRDNYVSYPATLDKKFDLILVDGRDRKRCLAEAYRLIRSDGSVLLHDAYRSRYDGGLKQFPDDCYLAYGLRRGRKLPVSKTVKLKNLLTILRWRYLLKPLYKLKSSIIKRIPFRKV